MIEVGQSERKTQNRIIELFKDKLDYQYLGNWQYRKDNSNIEKDILRKWLKKRKYSDKIIDKVFFKIEKDISIDSIHSLYDANQDFYNSLIHGVNIKPDIGETAIDVHLIDWNNIHNNEFAIAEEVTIKGKKHDKRPDIVIYINGIAIGIIELKSTINDVSKGIRQNFGNQTKIFTKEFFATIQLLMAGNDTQGLRYGVIGTPEKYWLEWKEESKIQEPLDKGFIQLCDKQRFLEIIHDFIVFDKGMKKT